MTTKPPATVWIAEWRANLRSLRIGTFASRHLAVVGAAHWTSKRRTWADAGDIAIWREQVIDELPHAFPPTALVAAIDTSDRVEAER